MKNFIKYKNKFAFLDSLIDDMMIVIIIVRVIIIILLMLIGMLYRYKYMPNYDENKVGYEYIFYYSHINGTNFKNNSLENLKYFTSHYILTHSLLPTSIPIILASTKIFQSFFLELFEKSLRTRPNHKMKCFSS